MANEQLLKYIKDQQEAGRTAAEIVDILTKNGWKKEVIEDAFYAASVSAPAPQVLTAVVPAPEKTITPAPQTPVKKNSRVKMLLKVVAILIGLLVLLYFLIPLLLNLIYKDAASVEDSDLKVTGSPIPQNSNAYYDVLEIKNKLYYTKDSFDVLNNPDKWNDAQVAQTLTKNADLLILLDRIIGKTRFQNPFFADPQKNALQVLTDSPEKFDPFSVLKTASVNELQSRKLYRQGKDNEALLVSLKPLKIGFLLGSDQPKLIEYLTGTALRNSSLEAARKILDGQKLSSDALISQIPVLENLKDTKEGITNALKAEYAFYFEAIDSVSKGNLPEGSDFSDISKSLNTSPVSKVKNSYLYQPNNTKNLFAGYFRKSISEMKQPCTSVQVLKLNKPPKFKMSPSVLFTQNTVGVILFNGFVSSLDISSQLQRKCDSSLSNAATQTLFALKAYKIDTGNLPQNLSDLSPKYLQKLPEDPYSGKPLQYKPEKKIIYSVGVNGQDQGGSTGDDWMSMQNPTFRINF